MTKWTCLFKPKSEGHGHLVFKDEEGWISVCDWSGDDPSQADDGPLYVAPETVVKVALRGSLEGAYSVYSEFTFPVLVARNRGEVGHVSTNYATIVALEMQGLRLIFKIDEKTDRVLREAARFLKVEDLK